MMSRRNINGKFRTVFSGKYLRKWAKQWMLKSVQVTIGRVCYMIICLVWLETSNNRMSLYVMLKNIKIENNLGINLQPILINKECRYSILIAYPSTVLL